MKGEIFCGLWTFCLIDVFVFYRNNLMLESTFLKIEREVDGDWQGN
jgi:hypothetical protein